MKKMSKKKILNKLFSKQYSHIIIKQLNRILFFLFILLLPVQFGKHFFFYFSYLSGVRIDYLAPTIYLTDIIVFFLFLLNIKTVARFLKQKTVFFLLLLFVFNILFSQSPIISIYRYIKVFELLIVFILFRNKIIDAKKILFGFVAGGVFELILVILQFVNKHSLQGLFYFFGERYFTLSTPGIAKASWQGLEILRPYGTFSHPNSLAGFYLLIYFYFLVNKKINKFLILKYFSLFVFSLLIFFSFSKVAILTYLILNTKYFILNTQKTCRFCILGKFLIIVTIALIFLQVKADPLSLNKRLDLSANAVKIISQHTLTGVGLGNYLISQNQFPIKYSYFFQQPVHNIFLLFTSEVGLATSAIIFWFLGKLIKNYLNKEVFIYVLLVVFMTGFFDHYWLTLQQNFLLLPLIFGASIRN